MSFAKFLTEQANLSTTKIIIQKILDNVDNIHVFKKDNSMKFNIGDAIGSKQLSNLDMVISENPHQSVKLGKSKKEESSFAIVVYTPSLPDRGSIDELISSNNVIYNGLVNEIQKFITNKKFNKIEKDGEEDKSVDFDEIYDSIISNVNSNIEQFENAVTSMKQDLESTNNLGKSTTLKMAIENLKSDTIGKDCEEFISNVKKHHKKDVEKLDKSDKVKLEKRLKSYYNSKVKKLVE